ncbi:tetratricopeptide repeat protein [Pseudidiomarina aestuarii]
MRLILISLLLISFPLWAQSNLQPKINEFDQLLAQQQQAQAIELAAQLHQQHPQDPIALMLQGRALAMQNQLPQATQLFQQAIEQDPTQVAPHFFLAQIYQNQGNFAQAAEELRIYLNERPNDNYELTYIELLARSNQPARTLAYLQHRLDQQSSKQQREQLQQQLQPIYAWAANILFRGPLIYPNNPEQLSGLQSTLNAMEAITNRGLMLDLNDGDWVVDTNLFAPQIELGRYEDIQNIYAAVAWANLANIPKSYEFILEIRNSNARTVGMIRVAEALAPAAPALAREWLRMAESWHELVVRNTNFAERNTAISDYDLLLGFEIAASPLMKINTQTAVRGEILRVLFHHFPDEFIELQAANNLQAVNNVNTLMPRLVAHKEFDAALELFDATTISPENATELNRGLLFADRRDDAERVTAAMIERFENPPPNDTEITGEQLLRQYSYMATDWAEFYGVAGAVKLVMLQKKNTETDYKKLYYGQTMAWLGIYTVAEEVRNSITSPGVQNQLVINKDDNDFRKAATTGKTDAALQALRSGNFDVDRDKGYLRSMLRSLQALKRWDTIEQLDKLAFSAMSQYVQMELLAGLIEHNVAAGNDISTYMERMLETAASPQNKNNRSTTDILAQAAYYASLYGRRGDLERVRELASSTRQQRAVHFGVLLAQMHELNQPQAANSSGTSRRR